MANLTGILSPPPLREKLVDNGFQDFLLRMYKKSNPREGLFSDGLVSEEMHRFLSTMFSRLSQLEMYGFPSVVLNSDFNFASGGTLPVTESDPSGTTVVDLWLAEYTGSPVFSFQATAYDPSDPNPTASNYYIDAQVSNLGDSLRLSQMQPQYVQKYAGQIIYFSAKVYNFGTNSPKIKPSILLSFDGVTEVQYFGPELNLETGINTMTSLIKVGKLEGQPLTNLNYVKFCVYLSDLDGGALSVGLQYFKFELADNATTLYVDHALEKARIDNF